VLPQQCAKLGHSKRSCHWQRYCRHFTDPKTYLLRPCNPYGTVQISAHLAPLVYTRTASKRKAMEEVDGQYLWRLCRDGHVPYSSIKSCLGQGSMEEHYSQQGLPMRKYDIVLLAWILWIVCQVSQKAYWKAAPYTSTLKHMKIKVGILKLLYTYLHISLSTITICFAHNYTR